MGHRDLQHSMALDMAIQRAAGIPSTGDSEIMQSDATQCAGIQKATAQQGSTASFAGRSVSAASVLLCQEVVMSGIGCGLRTVRCGRFGENTPHVVSHGVGADK